MATFGTKIPLAVSAPKNTNRESTVHLSTIWCHRWLHVRFGKKSRWMVEPTPLKTYYSNQIGSWSCRIRTKVRVQ